jgi:hypothetical protein
MILFLTSLEIAVVLNQPAYFRNPIGALQKKTHYKKFTTQIVLPVTLQCVKKGITHFV